MQSARFRLVDLAALVFVAVATVAPLVPALAQVRAAARAASCSQNFKMIGLALHNYQSTFAVFPPGRIWADPKTLAKDPKNSATDWGVGVMMLPFLDEARVYNLTNFALSWHAPANLTSSRTRVGAYLCPDDAHATATELLAPPGQPTNILFPLGSTAWSTHPASNRGPKPEGLFFDNSAVSIRDITDGTANTVMATEQVIDELRRGGPGDNGDCTGGPVAPKAFFDRTGTRWITGHPSSNYFNGRRTPNDSQPDCFDGVSPTGIGSLNRAPRSRHQNGVHVLVADGSVAFVRNNVDLRVWQTLLTRAGHEPIDRAVFAPVPRALAGPAKEPVAAGADARLLLTIDFQAMEASAVGGPITSVAKNGQVQLTLGFDAPGRTAALAEGHYVGLVIPANVRPEESPTALKVVRATVTEIDENAVKLVVAPSAAGQLSEGQILVLVRPPGTTTAQLRAVPDIVGFAEPGQSGVAPSLTPARNNLKQIGLALHNFHDRYGCFPPAVVKGPDGKPWHSWRVLILPFLDQAQLYQQYDFTQPWDSEKNRKVLEQMPAVYCDLVHGDQAGHVTHFAAITGPGTAFPAEGVTMKDGALPDYRGPGVRRVREVRDGTSLTIFAGSVSPERKIPWTKPEDVVFGPGFKKLGHAESFAAPHDGVGVFLFGDGRVRAISDQVSANMLAALLTIDGREIVDDAQVPVVGEPREPDREGRMPHGLQLLRTRDGVRLQFVE
jgi:hypothetical protein